MFEFIRERKKTLLVVLLLLVIPPFVVVGAWDQFNPNSEPIVASIDNIEISKREFDRAHQTFVDDFRKRVGESFSAEIFNTFEGKTVTLDNLIDRQIINQTTLNSGLSVSDESIRQVIVEIPEFQEKGVFNREKAQELLKKNGMNQAEFEERLRFDVSTNLIPTIISGSSFVPRSVARKIAQAENEKRDIKIKLYSPIEYKNKVSISNDEAKTFFEKNLDRFVLPARYDLAFLVSTNPDVADDLANRLYEEASSLENVAEEFNLEILNINGLDINAPAIDENFSNDILEALNSSEFRKAISTSDVLDEGLNSDLIEVKTNLFISANLVDKTPPKPMDFKLVSSQIESELLLQKMIALARDEAEIFLKKFEGSEDDKKRLLSQLRDSISISRNSDGSEIGGYASIVQSNTEAFFSHDFKVGSVKSIDAGRNGTLVAFLEKSSIFPNSNPQVVDSLGEVYTEMQQLDATLSLKSWVRSKEKSFEIKRYADQLGSSSIVEE